MIRIVTAAACLSLMVACASSPKVRYYALAPVPAESVKSTEPVFVGLGPMVFPEYLNRPHIVTRRSDTRIEMAEFDRWAEPLDAAFTRNLTNQIDRQLENATVIAFPYGNTVSAEYRVIGRVSRLDSDTSGNVSLVVQWGAGTVDGETIVPARVDAYSFRIDDPDDYDSIVAAFNRAIEALGHDITAALQPHMKAPAAQ